MTSGRGYKQLTKQLTVIRRSLLRTATHEPTAPCTQKHQLTSHYTHHRTEARFFRITATQNKLEIEKDFVL